jgi:iron complex transport system substrate-binding protein
MTELVYAAGAGAQLVGVSDFSDYPSAARKLPVIANHAAVNLESLLALKPDRVLAWKGGTGQRMIDAVIHAGFKVDILEGQRIDDVPGMMRAIGRIAGTQDEAERAARSYEERLANIRRQYAARPVVTAAIEIWHAPFMTVGGTHYMSDALTACGARNIFADLPGVTPEPGLEALVARDPMVIVGSGSAEDAARFQARWARFAQLKAVRDKGLVHVEADLLQRQTPRLLEGVLQLCEGIEKIRAARARNQR